MGFKGFPVLEDASWEMSLIFVYASWAALSRCCNVAEDMVGREWSSGLSYGGLTYRTVGQGRWSVQNRASLEWFRSHISPE